MRMPEEIKNGLEHCRNNAPCVECPYYDKRNRRYACEDELLDNALTYIQQLEVQMPRWISVEERLPDPFERVLVARKGKEELVVDWGFRDVGIWWKVYGTRTKNVFFWMPLPEPPRE